MNHIKLLILFSSLCCLSLHCKKESEEDKLPSVTNWGANTFGCLMNGKAWPMGRSGNLAPFYVTYWNEELVIQYTIYDDPMFTSIKERMVIIAKKINNVGEHFILFNDLNNGQFSARFNEQFYNSGYFTNYSGYASLNISRLDTTGPVRVVAGTFNFSLFDESGHSKLNVTKGRFDLVHYP
ncbi:MAG: hypothetical protein K1X81_08560 [Bacteroidia bacterium]|nr:hypothetical protein [Bacteroidia bacterium]